MAKKLKLKIAQLRMAVWCYAVRFLKQRNLKKQASYAKHKYSDACADYIVTFYKS